VAGEVPQHHYPFERGSGAGSVGVICSRADDTDERRNLMLKDFRAFVMRGNVLDLAVAVVIGIAFNAVVTSLVNDVIMQIIAAIVGKPNFNDLTFTVGDGIIYYGRFLTALITFLIIAATLFVIIRTFEELQKRRRKAGEVDEEELSDEVVLLGEIRDLLRARQ
jgi:large conductance mechanosensitive channel